MAPGANITRSGFITPPRIFNKDIQDVQDSKKPEIILEILNILVNNLFISQDPVSLLFTLDIPKERYI